MRVFKTKWFRRFARKEKISDKTLCEAIERAEQGLIDADLGDNIIKQRISRPNEGRSGGYRTIIAFRVKDLSFFIFGFAKSGHDNLKPDELKEYKEAAIELLAQSDEIIQVMMDNKELYEVNCDGDHQ